MKSLALSLLCSCLLLQADPAPSYSLVEDQTQLEIASPTLAGRQTAKLRLSNGLEAYLISDPGVPQSAAALAVQVGSWSDPEEYPGMAHFLEHMLFMGNEAYPQEFEYMQYINESGGKVNAYTASDRTVYMFSVNNDRFEGALDRFSHFFIDPLFLPSCIGRELHAVDQEHAKNIENDGWRQYMIFKETANRDHPCAKFSTGNAETLGGIPQEAMKKWYKEHYSAGKMHLVIYSALPIDELIDLTVSDFSAVAASTRDAERFPATMISDAQKGSMIYIKPVKNIKVLSITWELPEGLADENESMAGPLLSYILQNGGKNSLLATLKKEELAENVRVSEERFSTSNKIFNLDVELTDRGVAEVQQVITCCFEALARLKKTGIPRYIFDEAQSIADLSYRYQSRDDAFAFVSKSAHEMVDEKLETFPQKTVMPSEYSPDLYTQYIDHLTANKAIFFVIADPELTGVKPDRMEKWMGAEYAVRSVDPKQLQKWTSLRINSQIGLPLPNPYIPKSLDLVNNTFHEGTVIPELIAQTPGSKAYYSDDTQYLVPEVAYLFRIQTPMIDGSARSTALVDLYCKCLANSLYPVTQVAESAGSRVNVNQGKYAIDIAINGYSEPSFRLTENVFEMLKKATPNQAEYNVFKTSLLSQYENFSKELPVAQSLEIVSNVLFNNVPTNTEKYQALSKVSYEEFCAFVGDLFQKAYVQSLLYGNLTKSEAERLNNSTLAILDAEPFSEQLHYKREILLLPKSKGPFMISTQTPMQGNSAVLVIQEGPYSFDKRASQEVLAKVMKNEFFETLRTKQQTAYIAKAWEKEEENQLLQLFAVQSSSHQPSDLIARFELFLENFIKQYTTVLPQERFEVVREMAIKSLEMPPENLEISSRRLFALGFEHGGDFNLLSKRIKSLQDLTYNQTRKDAIEYLSRLNTRRLAVLTEGAPQKDREFRYELTSGEELKENGTFVTKNSEAVSDEAESQKL